MHATVHASLTTRLPDCFSCSTLMFFFLFLWTGGYWHSWIVYWYCIFWTLNSLPSMAIVSPKTDSLLLQNGYTFCIKKTGLVHFKIKSNNWYNLARQLHGITQTSILKSCSFTCHLQLKASAFGFQCQSASFWLWQSCYLKNRWRKTWNDCEPSYC